MNKLTINLSLLRKQESSKTIIEGWIPACAGMTNMITVNEMKLKPVLEKLYVKYNRRDLIAPDPLQFVYRYKT